VVEPFPFEHLPEIQGEHLPLVRQLRAQVGSQADAALVAWSRDLLGAGQEGTVAVRLGPIILGAEGERALKRGAGAASFELRGPAGLEATLILDARLVSGLRGLLLRAPAVPVVGELTPAERGLTAYAIAGLLQALGEGCAWTILLTAQRTQRQVGVEVEVTLGELTGLAWLLVDDDLLRQRPPSRRHRWPRRLGRLARQVLVLPAVTARLTLSTAEIDQLGEGDVLLSPACPGPRDGPEVASLCVGDGAFAITVDDQGATVTGGYQRQGDPDMDDAVAELDDTTLGDTTLAEALPVELVVELGRVKLTGAQVLDLESGDVVALERPLAGLVDLRVGGKLVARGELVNIDGEAGVRLTEVYD
jgi:type III secretion system YscQ/HrcQ family protein